MFLTLNKRRGAASSLYLIQRFITRSSSSSNNTRANALRRTLQGSVAAAGEQRLIDVYESLVQEGALRKDESQRRVAKKLGRLSEMLRNYQPPPPPPSLTGKEVLSVEEEKAQQDKTGGEKKVKEGVPKASSLAVKAAYDISSVSRVLRGMYIHGKVGTGKSLLMDLFFHHCPLSQKRRVHFHDFMLEVHARIHAWKQEMLKKEGRSVHIDLRPERNAITQVARQIGQEAHVLCFDEFQVTDVADAVIMVRLFGELWSRGIVMVATSNRAPEELYLDGINRPYFLPFIDLLKRQCVVIDMDSERDHRQSFETVQGAYFYPLNSNTRKLIDEAFLELAGGPGSSTTIPVMMGRRLIVPQASNCVCRFTFDDLCRSDVFAADYKAMCENFHTVIFENVPRLSAEKHNEARRFITLIDVLYESRTRLIISAAAPVLELFSEPSKVSASSSDGPLAGQTRAVKTGATATSATPQTKSPTSSLSLKHGNTAAVLDDDEEAHYVDVAQELIVPEGELSSVKELAFAFQRAASRLLEMSSSEYLENHMEACSHLYETTSANKGMNQ